MELQTFPINPPIWFNKHELEVNKNLNKKKSGVTPGSKLKRDPDCSSQGGRKKHAIFNDNVIDAICKLSLDEPIKHVFDPRNVEGLTHPNINGTDICLCWHCFGRCDTKCKCAATHVALGNELSKLCTYVKKAKVSFKAFNDLQHSDCNASTLEDTTTLAGETKTPGETGPP